MRCEVRYVAEQFIGRLVGHPALLVGKMWFAKTNRLHRLGVQKGGKCPGERERNDGGRSRENKIEEGRGEGEGEGEEKGRKGSEEVEGQTRRAAGHTGHLKLG